MKIRRKIEKLNNNTTSNVAGNGENASCQDRNMRLPKLNIKTFTGNQLNGQRLLNRLK